MQISDSEWLKLDNYPTAGNRSYSAIYISSFSQGYKLIQAYDVLGNGIYEYNFITNEWKQIIISPKATFKFNNDHIYRIKSVQYDAIRNQIYVGAAVHVKGSLDTFVKQISVHIDPQTHQFGIHEVPRHKPNKSIIINGKRYDLPTYSSLVTQSIAKSTGFERVLITANNDHDPGLDEYWYEELDGYRLVYIPYRDELVAIGGVEDDHPFGNHMNTIYSYSFSDNNWKKTDVILPKGLANFGCVLSNDQQCIIILGGSCNGESLYGRGELSKHSKTSNIYVWSLKNNTIKKSKIQCPVPACYEARITPVNIKAEVLICGYLRQCFREDDVNHSPMDVINMVQHMYVSEEIHLFESYNVKNNSGHWVIDVHLIINSVSW
eukprot:301389_1